MTYLEQVHEVSRAARQRLLKTVPAEPRAILDALGGTFIEREKYKLEGGYEIRVLEGNNGREAVVIGQGGRVQPEVRIYRTRQQKEEQSNEGR